MDEHDVKKGRHFFWSALEHFPYGICITDRERNIIMFNKAAEAITGYRTDDVVGKPVWMLYPENAPRKLDFAPLGKGERMKHEHLFRKKDGTSVPVTVSYSLCDPSDPAGSAIIESYSDQSERKRLEQLKNEFVFVAAHELRNPVTAIKLLLDLIFEDKRISIEPILRDYLEKIEEAEQRLRQLVDDLLEVSRSEAGRLKIKIAPQNMSQHVLAILNELKPTAVTKNVSLHYEPTVGSHHVLADSAKLKEIIANLVSNAIKYNVSGGRVEVSHELMNGMLVTHVTDTGIGISAEDQKRLYEKFWRSEEHVVRSQAGTGLGLFIVKELVERMGGKIWVRSAHAKGSTFSFSLPLATRRRS